MPQGLTTDAVRAYQRVHGFNEMREERASLLLTIAKRILSPISAMLIIAAGLSYLSGRAFDGTFILILLVLNITIALYQEHKADAAIEKLNAHLTVSVHTLRDGAWQIVPSRSLVPGDLVQLKAGGIIPADASVEEAVNASVNESALTGESLPKEKKVGDTLYSGSFVASGIMTARVSAIGSSTYFGKTVTKTDGTKKRSALERDILRISRFLSALSIFAIVLLSFTLIHSHATFLEIARLDLSLVIAGIPISLPTVMTLIIAYGILSLAHRQVIVRRLSALEELANTDLLLTDKTGTLTKNQITVSGVYSYGSYAGESVRSLGALVAAQDPDEFLNQAILREKGAPEARIISYTPADSTRKRATLRYSDGDTIRQLSLGAPQVIRSLCASLPAAYEQDVSSLAARGYRALALAVGSDAQERNMQLIGLFGLSDELRDDAKETVAFMEDNGIGVVMLTGDNRAIAAEIASKIALQGKRIIAHEELAQMDDATIATALGDARAFAEILPEDKLRLVEEAKKHYTVAVNGDGVNDLPAVRAASVGFAVHNAVDALKSSADIVLLSEGIGVMKDAFIEGRRIFERLYAYSLYRISESFRLIVTIVVLGLISGTYPLSPLQLILLALLNDIPIISLATDTVEVAHRPSSIRVARQFSQSILYGLVGIGNSLLLYILAVHYLHVSLATLQTLFFLKLTVSGHLLIYVVHTRSRWWRQLPSTPVILSTSITQALATWLALSGFLMPAPISPGYALLVWVWSFAFMQLSELMKRKR